MLIIKLKTFIKSLLFHVWTGFPKSSIEEIEYRYSICSGCDKFDIKNNECTICGCSINRKKVFFNKLAWADQECPEKKWLKNIR